MIFTKIANIILEHKFISDLQLVRDKMLLYYVYIHTHKIIIYGNRIVFLSFIWIYYTMHLYYD